MLLVLFKTPKPPLWLVRGRSTAGPSHSHEPIRDTARLDYEALGDGITFYALPFEKETEITGPLMAKLFVASSTSDADLFLVFRVFKPDGQEVVFQGALDPHTPIGQGWLRASHRKLDHKLNTRPGAPITATTSAGH